MIILGLNSFHGDLSAALVIDGKLVAAAEEERFCRLKHWAGFPSQAIGYKLSPVIVRTKIGAASRILHECPMSETRTMLDRITPVILTHNEADNIGRTLARLAWAKTIVVVDNDSTDGTLDIVARFSNARLFNRPFVTHADKWRFAVQETGITTDWILRLDADYQVPEELVAEMVRLDPAAPVAAYRIGFDYAIFGRRLIGSLYPSNTILLRRGKFSVIDRGHTEAWTIDGRVGGLSARVVHDDWKTTARWLNDQGRYMTRELDRIEQHGGAIGWLRRHPPLAPFVVFFYCLFGKGLILNGRRGVFYALQRMVAEAVLSLITLERGFRKSAGADKDPPA